MLLGIQFSVSISARLSEALKLLGEQRFELIVFFQASENWIRLVGFSSRQIPAPKLLAITAEEGESPEWADVFMYRNRTPNELIRTCTEMFGMASKTKSRGYSDRSLKKVVPIS
jgi:hypothetical protein